mmetsp:Transcript_8822/g.19029  ORF Transcript_8822/g.19029 Transcript_8822/m.19029 type:complete len:107 (-) Transcript_8822:951-1271(-)
MTDKATKKPHAAEVVDVRVVDARKKPPHAEEEADEMPRAVMAWMKATATMSAAQSDVRMTASRLEEGRCGVAVVVPRSHAEDGVPKMDGAKGEREEEPHREVAEPH